MSLCASLCVSVYFQGSTQVSEAAKEKPYIGSFCSALKNTSTVYIALACKFCQTRDLNETTVCHGIERQNTISLESHA